MPHLDDNPALLPALPGESLESWLKRNDPWTREKCQSGIQCCLTCVSWDCCDNINPKRHQELTTSRSEAATGFEEVSHVEIVQPQDGPGLPVS